MPEPTVTIPAKELLDLIEKIAKLPQFPGGEHLHRAEVLYACQMINITLARWLKSSLA